MTASHTNGHGRYTGLLVDYGGVLTTNLFDSFRSFCEESNIAPDEIRRRFREDRASRELLIGLETGEIGEEEFEPQFAAMLGVPAAGLIDHLFAGSAPDQPMVDAVLKARHGGIRTGLISNSWGTRRYDRGQLASCSTGS